MSVTNPAEVEVANLASESDLSFLNADEADSAPPEKAEPVVEPAKEVTPEAPVLKTPSHPQALLDAARRVGVEEHHLAPGVIDTQALVDFVVKMQLQEAAARVAAPTPKAEVEEDDDAILNYVEHEMQADKKLVALMRRQNKQVKELREKDALRDKKLQEIEGREVQRQQRSLVHAIETTIEKLGPKYEVVLGKGPMQMLQDEDAKAARNAIVASSGIDWANDSPSVAAKKYEAAAKKVYGKLLDAVPAKPEPKNGKAPPTADEWANGGLGRPTGSLESKGKKAAAEHVRQFLRDRNITPDQNDDEYDGIPN